MKLNCMYGPGGLPQQVRLLRAAAAGVSGAGRGGWAREKNLMNE